MSIPASTRHLALIAVFSLAIGSLSATVGQAAISSSGSTGSQVSWLPPTDHLGGSGSDGDPDNPTVDQPQTRTKGAPGKSEPGIPPSVGFGGESDVWVWWSRLLRLIGIR